MESWYEKFVEDNQSSTWDDVVREFKREFDDSVGNTSVEIKFDARKQNI